MINLTVEQAARLFVPFCDDYRGQVGRKLDPVTHSPTGGVIFDCNQHGHTIRPYVPPRRSVPNVILYWHQAHPPYPFFDLYAAVFAQYNVGSRAWIGQQSVGDYLFMVQIVINEPAHRNTMILDVRTPLGYAYSAMFSAADVLAETTTPEIEYPQDSYVKTHGDLRGPIPPTVHQIECHQIFETHANEWGDEWGDFQERYRQRARPRGLTGYNLFMKEHLRKVNPCPE